MSEYSIDMVPTETNENNYSLTTAQLAKRAIKDMIPTPNHEGKWGYYDVASHYCSKEGKEVDMNGININRTDTLRLERYAAGKVFSAAEVIIEPSFSQPEGTQRVIAAPSLTLKGPDDAKFTAPGFTLYTNKLRIKDASGTKEYNIEESDWREKLAKDFPNLADKISPFEEAEHVH